eukprot:gene12586-21300_t
MDVLNLILFLNGPRRPRAGALALWGTRGASHHGDGRKGLEAAADAYKRVDRDPFPAG